MRGTVPDKIITYRKEIVLELISVMDYLTEIALELILVMIQSNTVSRHNL